MLPLEQIKNIYILKVAFSACSIELVHKIRKTQLPQLKSPRPWGHCQPMYAAPQNGTMFGDAGVRPNEGQVSGGNMNVVVL